MLRNAPGATGGVFFGPSPGRGGPRVPLPAAILRPGAPFGQTGLPPAIEAPARLEPRRGPLFGSLELDGDREAEGPPDGLTLDLAIERLIRDNLDLKTEFFEIPQAQADILTASLRANPIFFADATAIPYGNFSPARPGGQTQYDISVTHPFDLSGKRRARTVVATRAKRVLEAQYQDAVRLQIDNLCTAYVDVLASRETLRFAKASVAGLSKIVEVTQRQFKVGVKAVADLKLVQAQLEAAKVGQRDAEGLALKSKWTLGALLNVAPDQCEFIEVRGTMRDLGVEPPPLENLIQRAIECRPDLAAYRLGVDRARSEVDLAKANRYSDVYAMYAPYVFQNNAPFGTKSAHSWSAGITIPLPLYNRNQGNIERARLNVVQTQTGLLALQRRVVMEVQNADQEFDLTRDAIAQIESDLLPASRTVFERRTDLYVKGQTDILDFLKAQREYNEVVRDYRDVLVRHKRSRYTLNTAVGERVLP